MPTRSMKIYNANDVRETLKRKHEFETDAEGGGSNPRNKKIKHLSKSQRTYMEISRESQERMLHSLFPAFNLNHIPATLDTDFQKYPSHEFSKPKPIYVSNTRTRFSETCQRRPIAYELWRRRLLLLRTSYMSALRTNRGLKHLEEIGSYHARVYELAEHRHLNPDPYFDGTYDFYFTGGNLALLSSASPQMNSPLVIHSNGRHLNKFAISEFDASNSTLNLGPIHSGRCNEISEIFEMKKLSCYDINHHDMFAIRQLNKITLQKVHYCKPHNDKDTTERGNDEHHLEPVEISLTPLTEFKSNTPFISFAQTSMDSQKFLISNMKQQVRLYDQSLDKPYMTNMYKLSPDDTISYNILRPWLGETVLYANKNFLCPMDLRTEPKEWLNKSVCSDNSTFLDCDMITTFCLSISNMNNIYVATNHKLHCLDMRYMTGSLGGKGSIATYTHQLENAPKLIDVYANENNEFVALSSAKPNDLSICEFSHATPIERQLIMPYQPQSMEESLQSARQAAFCLDPTSQIKQRIKSFTTGLAFYDINEKNGAEQSAYLMCSNSIGDVNARVVKLRDNEENDKSPDFDGNVCHNIMDKYSEQIIEKTPQLFICNGVHNLSALRKIVKNDLFSLSETMEKQKKVDKNKFFHATHGQNWRKPMHTLTKYTDLLAKDLHSIWDIDFEHITTISTIDKKLEEKNTNFINEWVEKQANTTLQQPIPPPVVPTTIGSTLRRDPGSPQGTSRPRIVTSAESRNYNATVFYSGSPTPLQQQQQPPVVLANRNVEFEIEPQTTMPSNLLLDEIKYEAPESPISIGEHVMVVVPFKNLDENLITNKNKKMLLSQKKQKGF